MTEQAKNTAAHRATNKYRRKQVTEKTIILNNTKDAALIDAIKNYTENNKRGAFTQLARELLNEHFGIGKE